jgi:hypothetical protein
LPKNKLLELIRNSLCADKHASDLDLFEYILYVFLVSVLPSDQSV